VCNQLFLLHFFSLQLDTWIKSYDVLSETPHILEKTIFMYSFKMRTTVS